MVSGQKEPKTGLYFIKVQISVSHIFKINFILYFIEEFKKNILFILLLMKYEISTVSKLKPGQGKKNLFYGCD